MDLAFFRTERISSFRRSPDAPFFIFPFFLFEPTAFYASPRRPPPSQPLCLRGLRLQRRFLFPSSFFIQEVLESPPRPAIRTSPASTSSLYTDFFELFSPQCRNPFFLSPHPTNRLLIFKKYSGAPSLGSGDPEFSCLDFYFSDCPPSGLGDGLLERLANSCFLSFRLVSARQFGGDRLPVPPFHP